MLNGAIQCSIFIADLYARRASVQRHEILLGNGTCGGSRVQATASPSPAFRSGCTSHIPASKSYHQNRKLYPYSLYQSIAFNIIFSATSYLVDVHIIEFTARNSPAETPSAKVTIFRNTTTQLALKPFFVVVTFNV